MQKTEAGEERKLETWEMQRSTEFVRARSACCPILYDQALLEYSVHPGLYRNIEMSEGAGRWSLTMIKGLDQDRNEQIVNLEKEGGLFKNGFQVMGTINRQK